jgi:hypothetical protein
MKAGNVHSLPKIEAMCPVPLRTGIQVQIITARLPREIAQPVNQNLSITPGARVACGHKIVDVQILPHEQAGKYPVPGNRNDGPVIFNESQAITLCLHVTNHRNKRRRVEVRPQLGKNGKATRYFCIRLRYDRYKHVMTTWNPIVRQLRIASREWAMGPGPNMKKARKRASMKYGCRLVVLWRLRNESAFAVVVEAGIFDVAAFK